MLTKDDIIAIVSSELSIANSGIYNGDTSLEESLAYYVGEVPGPSIEGRSSVVSTDVADAIEWILPQVMKSFTQNNEVVIFDPVHEGDEKQAELESEYVYEVLMKQNDGFIILHQFVKDALMQNNGILKVYYANKTEVKSSNYTGITEEQLTQLLSAEGVELVERSEYIDQAKTEAKQQGIQQEVMQIQQKGQQLLQQQQQMPPEQMMQMAGKAEQRLEQLEQEMQAPVLSYDVKVSVTRIRGKIYIDPVPPEEFRLSSNHNSINLDDARFTAHVVLKSVSDIMEEYGLSLEQTNELPEGASYYAREYRFAAQDESVFYDRVDSGDDSQRLIEVSECFLQMDIDETGISKLMKITVAGGDSPTDLLQVEEIEEMPWVSTTTFLMSHKFKGLSITDRLKEIQNQKTAIWRNILDNMYLQNNQRTVVVEGQVNLDDLLVSRPGGIVRAKRLDAIMPLQTPPLGPDAYNMMEYLDKVRAGRTGVDPDGGASPADIGDRVGSQGVERMMNAKEELVGLIIRVVAETGIKPLCVKIRDLSVRHIDAVVDFRFRGQWEKINPREWLDRTQCTVRVGTGTGNHQAQVAALQQVMMIQEKLMQAPGQYLVDYNQAYTALDDFCKFSGLNGATRYFIDPMSNEGQQRKQMIGKQSEEGKQKEEQIQMAMAKSQMDLAKAEQGKAQAQMLSAQSKAEVDTVKNQLQLQKQVSEGEIDLLKQQLDEAKAIADNMGKSAELELKEYDIETKVALELTRIEAQANTDENENFKENKEVVAPDE